MEKKVKKDVLEMADYPGNSPIEAMVVFNSALSSQITLYKEGIELIKNDK